MCAVSVLERFSADVVYSEAGVVWVCVVSASTDSVSRTYVVVTRGTTG